MAQRRGVHVAIFLISGVGIAYQVALMRVFTIAQWHHLAYMIISIAMLGFGASGTAVSLARGRIRGREETLMRVSALLLTVSLVACYMVSQRIPFETYELVAQPGQLWNLLGLYTVLALPFFFVSTCIMMSFLLATDAVGRLYFVNMFGSGAGAAAAVWLLFLMHPSGIPYALALPAALAYLLLARARPHGLLRGVALLAAAAGLLVSGYRQPIRVSPYKGLSYARQYPDARIVAEKVSPLSVITAVASKQIRETPGQISNYPMRELGELPEQIGLFFDAGGVSPVLGAPASLPAAPNRFAYLDYATSAVAYRAAPANPSVLVIGAGGGADVWGALWHGARHVTAVEMDPGVVALMGNELKDFSGGLYARPDVTPVIAEGRGFLQSHTERFDLIQIALLDSFLSAAAGVHALNENYLYTVEAVSLALERLTPTGVLAMTCWLKTPPRDSLKLFATAVTACERKGIADLGRHLVFIRSWNTATIVVTRAPLEAGQVQAVRDFCAARWFDGCYYPGITLAEANRYVILDRPVHYEFAQGMLSPDREALYNDFLFHVRPATDDRPYFFQFFKWASFPRLVRGMGAEWLPFIEWGYVVLIATLAQSLLVSAVFIVLPVAVFARVAAVRGVKRWVVGYFAALGCAYMFLEIAFIQRFVLFLAHPIYAVAAVLTAFLVFSGLGSLFAHYRLMRLRRNTEGVSGISLSETSTLPAEMFLTKKLMGDAAKRVPPYRRHYAAGKDAGAPSAGTRTMYFAVAGVLVLAAVYFLFLTPLFAAGAAWPGAVKFLISIALLAPLAFCMGIPFPIGLQLTADTFEPLLPWAWAINGCLSVIGTLLATLIAIHFGFQVLVLLAALVYVAAAFSLWRLTSTACGMKDEG